MNLGERICVYIFLWFCLNYFSELFFGNRGDVFESIIFGSYFLLDKYMVSNFVVCVLGYRVWGWF